MVFAQNTSTTSLELKKSAKSMVLFQPPLCWLLPTSRQRICGFRRLLAANRVTKVVILHALGERLSVFVDTQAGEWRWWCSSRVREHGQHADPNRNRSKPPELDLPKRKHDVANEDPHDLVVR